MYLNRLPVIDTFLAIPNVFRQVPSKFCSLIVDESERFVLVGMMLFALARYSDFKKGQCNHLVVFNR